MLCCDTKTKHTYEHNSWLVLRVMMRKKYSFENNERITCIEFLLQMLPEVKPDIGCIDTLISVTQAILTLVE